MSSINYDNDGTVTDENKDDQNYIVDTSNKFIYVKDKLIKPDEHIENYWFILKIFLVKISISIGQNYNSLVKQMSDKFNKYQSECSYIVIISDISDIIISLADSLIVNQHKNLKEEYRLLIKNIGRWNKCLYQTYKDKLLMKYNINPLNYSINIDMDKKMSSIPLMYIRIIDKLEYELIPDYNSINIDNYSTDEIIIILLKKLVPKLISHKKINLMEIIDINTDINCKDKIIDIIINNIKNSDSECPNKIEKLIKMKNTIKIKTLFRKYDNMIL